MGSQRRLDMATMRRNIRAPGMDTRVNSSRAEVRKFGIHPKFGPMADVILLPSRAPETCYVKSEYAGDGWGLYRPMHKGDKVLVVNTNGDPNESPTIIGMYHSPTAKVPKAFLQNPDDFILWVKPNKNLRLGAQGSGNIILTTVDGAVQVLGSTPNAAQFYPLDPTEALRKDSPKRFTANSGAPFMFCASGNPSDLNPTQMVIRGTLYLSREQALMNALGTYVTAVALAVPATSPASVPLLLALSKFMSGFPNYLTPNVLVDDPGALPPSPFP